MRAAVPDQVELDVTAPPVKLEVAFTLAIGRIFALFNNRQVGQQKRIRHALHHGEAPVSAQLLKIVKKHSAHAARLLAVLQVKILVAPLLESRVLVAAEGCQSIFADLVKMHRVFIESVIRRQVHAATEPADGLTCTVYRRGRQHAYIHVHGWHIGISRMKYQRNADGLKGRTRQFGPVLGGRSGKLGAAHMRKPATCSLKHLALFQDQGDAVALKRLSSFFLPCVGHKRVAVKLAHSADNALLQPEQKGANV